MENENYSGYPEFNNGFVTALGLFYGHSMNPSIRDKQSAHLVLYGATDHLADIEYPENISQELKEKISNFVDLAFSYRLSWDTPINDIYSIFEACREILKQIDEEVFGLEVEITHG